MIRWFERRFPAAAYALQNLSGGSFGSFMKRFFRLHRVAAAIVWRKDRAARPVRLQIETTDVCNFRCRMCTREVLSDMNTGSMSLDQFQGLVQAAEPFYVTLNGLGEPLIDTTFAEKLAFMHERGIMTSMPTNGTFLQGKKLDKLAANMPNIVTFSLDGATKESFEGIRIRARFDRVVKNYGQLAKLVREGKTRSGASIRVLCTLQKDNLHDYRPMFEILENMGLLGDIGLVPVFDYDTDQGAFQDVIPTPEEVRRLHVDLEAAIDETDNEREQRFYKQWRDASASWLNPPAEPESQAGARCMIPWYSSYIDTKGRVYPCCYLTNTDAVMGNVNEESLESIWNGENYRRFRRQILEDRGAMPVCGSICARNDNELEGTLRRFRWLLVG